MDWSNYDYNQRKSEETTKEMNLVMRSLIQMGEALLKNEAGDQNGDENGRELPKER